MAVEVVAAAAETAGACAVRAMVVSPSSAKAGVPDVAVSRPECLVSFPPSAILFRSRGVRLSADVAAVCS